MRKRIGSIAGALLAVSLTAGGAALPLGAPRSTSPAAAAAGLAVSVAEAATSPGDPAAPQGGAATQPSGASRSPRLLRATVRGIYLTGRTASSAQRLGELLALVDRTELNGMVIDVKSDWGTLTYRSDVPLAIEAGAGKGPIADLRALVTRLKEHDVYAIGRVVTFKDNYLPRHRPDLAVQRAGGGLWQDRKGMTWLNPYKKEAWEYVINVAKEVAAAGFDEIQFDYVRFPTDGDVSQIVYPGRDGRRREQVIADFLTYAREQLEPLGVWVSADIFGIMTMATDDQGIGQLLEEVARGPHILSPMVYPSHYGPGNYGFANPNAHPYETVYRALQDAHRRLGEKFPDLIIRPWLQDFTLGQPPYGAREVRAQIRATYDSGIQEWLLWNAANVYTEAALGPADETPPLPPPRIIVWGTARTAARVRLEAY
ncbi:putative glycoside hydrolase [Caldinitratiruptor microaerophilus]|uniref:DUF4015 domain-containing protein n=1 Tax=Caldinitratiruptor microaerophilus TaxID=671077 RepID=A0AA35CQT5_9FIRM|nr:putative glycoside hydrolase [Caldinitratiruptor microaerophilus]BDG62110.1 hypothetical protein caldi_32000 [Caldinitratiruptor microaerophilus]